MAVGGRFFRSIALIRSGPGALEFFRFLIQDSTSWLGISFVKSLSLSGTCMLRRARG